MQKSLPVAALAAAAAGVLVSAAACGGGGEAQPTPTPTAEVQAPTPEPTPTPEAAAPEPAVQTLAFIDDGDIWLVDADGTNRRRITQFGGTDREVVSFQWLANGQEIAYEVSFPFDPDSDCPFAGCTASGLASIDGQVLWEGDGGQWSPDGQLVALYGLAVSIEDREGRSVWTSAAGGGPSSWSADGSVFAIVEGSDIVVVSRNGTIVSRLRPGASPDAAEDLPKGACASIEQLRRFSPDEELFLGVPRLSPDGKTILIAVNCSINSGTGGLFNTIIRELSLDGLIDRPVPNSMFNGDLFTPPFSPDGRRIALLQRIQGEWCPYGASALATMDLDILDLQGGDRGQLVPREIAQLVGDLATEGRTADIEISRVQHWSPVGDAILTSFSATECVLDEDQPNEEGEHRLLAEGVYLLRVDGVADETVADEFSGGSLSWSPSGDLIAYATGEPDAPLIRLFDLVTGEVTDLGPGHSPAWRPLPPDAATLPWEGAVTDNLRIRSEANTASDTVGTLPKGAKVRVYGEAEGEEAEPGSGNRTWYRVIGGWVYSAFVQR
jgi:Tol biopolymer transport system component